VPRAQWEQFVLSPEVAALVHDVFTFRMDDTAPSLTDIQVAFTATWLSFLDDHHLSSAYDVSTFFDELVGVCNRVLDTAIANQALSGHEAKSEARHKVVLARLESLAARPDRVPPVRSDLARFERELRTAVGARYSTIEPPNVFEKQRVPIDELYVTPSFGGVALGDQGADLEGLLAQLSRRVVLGHPGAGKSTLTAKLCNDLAGRNAQPRGTGRDVTPWAIELRKYAAVKAQRSLSLLDYFEQWAETSYLLSVPCGAFRALLEAGRLLVLFDGLDELLDTSRRIEIRDEIESFCFQFPFSLVLVTSRRVGYDQAPLDDDIFDVVYLLDFDEGRVEEYAERWFTYQLASEPVVDRRDRIDHFLRESAVVSELRRSPLLLALLCSSYRGAGFIPKNLPDVYDSCATLLFSTWDKQRQIDVLLPFAEHVRPALRDLAWWLITTGGVESSVTKRQAIERTTHYLHQRRFGDIDEARAAAEEFIEFCRGRAWVFTDQGTTATGEPLFGFTHRTFLEFFAAEHLAFRNEPASDLVMRLAPRIVAEEWDVVAQISLQIKARSYPDGADDVVKALYESIRRLKGEQLFVGIDFMLRFMRAVIPSPPVSRQIAKNMTALATRLWRSGDPVHGRKVLAAIATVGSELRGEAAKGLAAAIVTMLRNDRPAVRQAGSELLAYQELIGIVYDESSEAFWTDVCQQVMGTGTVIRDAALRDAQVAIDWYFDLDDPLELLARHGVGFVLWERRLLLIGRREPCVANRAFARWHATRHGEPARALLGTVGRTSIGGELARLPPAERWHADTGVLGAIAALPAAAVLTSTEFLGLWFLAASAVEWIVAGDRRATPDLQEFADAHLDKVRALGEIVAGRLGSDERDVRRVISDLGLGDDVGSLIQRWANRTINVLER
jgi:hypothetical protein